MQALARLHIEFISNKAMNQVWPTDAISLDIRYKNPSVQSTHIIVGYEYVIFHGCVGELSDFS